MVNGNSLYFVDESSQQLCRAVVSLSLQTERRPGRLSKVALPPVRRLVHGRAGI